jgi:hypothetical protein
MHTVYTNIRIYAQNLHFFVFFLLMIAHQYLIRLYLQKTSN